MKSWKQALRDSVISGSWASLASTATLAARSQIENGTPYAATNATSHVFWEERALRQDRPSLRYTAAGYGVHHGSAIFWAIIYEKLFGARAEAGEVLPALAGGLAVAGLASFVDYQLTPKRLQPGYEERLSTPSLLWVYGVLGLSFAIRGLISEDRRRT